MKKNIIIVGLLFILIFSTLFIDAESTNKCYKPNNLFLVGLREKSFVGDTPTGKGLNMSDGKYLLIKDIFGIYWWKKI